MRAFRGVAAARAYVTAVFREFPGLRIHDARVVAERGDTIVVEHQLLNGDPSLGPLRPQGSVCEIYRVRDGRVVAYRSYYAAEEADREDVVNVPSRAEASKMAEEHAALRRVATLVARGVSQDELFAAVIEEIGWLVGADPTSLIRFEADDTVTLVAAWSAADADFPIGARRPVDDALRSMRDDGRAVRFGPMELPLDGPFVEEARQLAIRSAVGVPIVVDGLVWGVAVAASTREEPFPGDTETRLAQFTELLATAISNAEARADASRLAEEQAALRRVATLVAHESSPSEVSAAVAKEVAGLLGVENVRMARYEADATVTVVAEWGEPDAPFPVGTRLPLGGKNIASQVLRTERPVRIETAEATGAVGDYVRGMGSRSAVGAPIVVDGRLWGVMVATSPEGGSLPADTESRLENFTELVATAISNTEARTELAASRARIVAATDEERRRVVRDLHDGAQQRLVHTIMTLKHARRRSRRTTRMPSALVTEALDQAEQANGRVARARPRHPPSGAHARRAARGSGRTGLADAGAGRERRVGRPAPCRGRGDRILRRRRGAHQRRQTRSRRARRRHRARRGRHARRPRPRRRRRRRPAQRQRPHRADGPARRPRRRAPGRKPGRPRHRGRRDHPPTRVAHRVTRLMPPGRRAPQARTERERSTLRRRRGARPHRRDGAERLQARGWR